MRSTLWAIAAAALVLGGSTLITSAQGAGARKAAKAPYAKSAKAAPPAKRYYYSGYKTCGQYRYSKGGKCVDARTNPPSLK
jgi:hypothetical protein